MDEQFDPVIRQIYLAIYRKEPTMLSAQMRAWCEMWVALQRAAEKEKQNGSNDSRT